MTMQRIIPLTEGTHGEWWIMSGSVEYADDHTNHELIVIGLMARIIGDALEIEYDEEFPDIDELLTAVDRIAFKMNANPAEVLTKAGIDHADDMLGCLTGHDDPREFAMEHWGWQRVVNHSIETWLLTPQDRDNILEGLYEIGELHPEDEYDIYVYSSGESFTYTVAELGEGTGADAEVYWNREAAKTQNREADIAAMHPYYRQLANPIGDSIEKTGKYI